MYVTPEQIQNTSKANVESLLSLASTQFSALEKLVALNSTVLKGAFEDTIANARALAGAKDVQEFFSLQASFAQPAIDKAITYSKSVYEVAPRLPRASAAQAAVRCGRPARRNSFGRNPRQGSSPQSPASAGLFLLACGGLVPQPFDARQQVVDEGQRNDHGRKKTDHRYVRNKRKRPSKQQQRSAGLRKDPLHFLRGGMLGERVVAQDPLVHPGEDHHRYHRPQRRE